MVSFTVYKANSGGAYVEGVCLATDEKPVAGITNGSILFSVDTTDGSLTRYMFDQNSATWIETECPCSGGGSGGGSSLPEVTSDDNGDVLTVVSGAWAAAAAPSGVVPVVVTLDAIGGYFSIDASYNDLKAAVEAGKIVAGVETVDDESGTSYTYSFLGSLSESVQGDESVLYTAFFGGFTEYTFEMYATDPDDPMTGASGG